MVTSQGKETFFCQTNEETFLCHATNIHTKIRNIIVLNKFDSETSTTNFYTKFVLVYEI